MSNPFQLREANTYGYEDIESLLEDRIEGKYKLRQLENFILNRRTTKNQDYALFLTAIMYNQNNEVLEILSNNIDINITREKSGTPLMIATHWRNYPIVDFFLEKGSDANIQDSDGNTALNIYLFSKKKSDDYFLNDKKTNEKIDLPGFYTQSSKQSLTHKDDVLFGDIFDLLIDRTNLSLLNNKRQTPLHIASELGNMKAVKALLKKREIDIFQKDSNELLAHEVTSDRSISSLIKTRQDEIERGINFSFGSKSRRSKNKETFPQKSRSKKSLRKTRKSKSKKSLKRIRKSKSKKSLKRIRKSKSKKSLRRTRKSKSKKI